jgi:UDP:flavonoid glycosyltransferase YjiC (YdhE family)
VTSQRSRLTSARLRILIGAFGDPGHAFPAIALGRELAGRGHEVALQTWKKWDEHVRREGMSFHPAPEYQVFPTRERPLKPYEAVVRATAETQPLVREFQPDVVVSDILTLAPALAGELEGCRWATLVPHIYPPPAPGIPPFGLGAPPPRGRVGKAVWDALSPRMEAGLERGRRELNETRRRVGLPELPYAHGGISRDLCIVGTFPQLEYPRHWPPEARVTGPVLWEPPAADVDPPPGDEPVVMVASSTSQDPDQRLLSTSLEALSGLPVRLLATYARGSPPRTRTMPAKTRLVEWMSYASAMPRADLVICHGGHGTLARALASGAPVVTVPAAGDMIENGVRAQWAGTGLTLPKRFLSPRSLRLIVERVLGDDGFRARARELAAWAQRNDGPTHAARLVEGFGSGGLAAPGSG